MAKPPPSMLEALVPSPALTLFLVIGLGYLAGELNVFGFRLGVAGVLFAGLACGSISPAWHCPNWWLRSGSSFSYTPSAFIDHPRQRRPHAAPDRSAALLATAGTRAGAGLLDTLRESGLTLLAAGAFITVAVAAFVLLLGRR